MTIIADRLRSYLENIGVAETPKTIQDRIRELDKIVTIDKGALCTIAVVSADAATKDFMSPKKFCPRPTTERGENLEYPHSP